MLNETHIFDPTLTATFYATAGRFAHTQISIAPSLQTLQSFGQQVPRGTSVPIFPGIRSNILGFVNIFSGGGFERDRVDANDYSYTPGDNAFNGQASGSALADFYLGRESQFFQDNGRTFYLRQSRPSLYAQDDWKLARQFTLNLGVRWEPWLPPTDLDPSLTAFVPGQRSVVAPGAPVGLPYPGDAGIGEAVFKNHWNDFTPRAGFAWNVGADQKTVIRGAYGIFYGFPEGLLYQRTDTTQPTDLYLSIPAPQNFTTGRPIIPAAARSRARTSHPVNLQTTPSCFPFRAACSILRRASIPQNWNFTVERQFSNNTAVSVAYVGNHAVNVMGSRQFNPAIFGPGATVANDNSRRLYPGLGAVELASSYVYTEYNGLQLNVTKRMHNDLTLLSNLVWSKTIDNTSSATEGNAGPPNPFNFASARGPADFDQQYRFTLSAVYFCRASAFKVSAALSSMAGS